MSNTPQGPKSLPFSEDWLAIIISFILILLAASGILGKTGLLITF